MKLFIYILGLTLLLISIVNFEVSVSVGVALSMLYTLFMVMIFLSISRGEINKDHINTMKSEISGLRGTINERTEKPIESYVSVSDVKDEYVDKARRYGELISIGEGENYMPKKLLQDLKIQKSLLYK